MNKHFYIYMNRREFKRAHLQLTKLTGSTRQFDVFKRFRLTQTTKRNKSKQNLVLLKHVTGLRLVGEENLRGRLQNVSKHLCLSLGSLANFQDSARPQQKICCSFETPERLQQLQRSEF